MIQILAGIATILGPPIAIWAVYKQFKKGNSPKNTNIILNSSPHEVVITIRPTSAQNSYTLELPPSEESRISQELQIATRLIGNKVNIDTFRPEIYHVIDTIVNNFRLSDITNQNLKNPSASYRQLQMLINESPIGGEVLRFMPAYYLSEFKSGEKSCVLEIIWTKFTENKVKKSIANNYDDLLKCEKIENSYELVVFCWSLVNILFLTQGRSKKISIEQIYSISSYLIRRLYGVGEAEQKAILWALRWSAYVTTNSKGSFSLGEGNIRYLFSLLAKTSDYKIVSRALEIIHLSSGQPISYHNLPILKGSYKISKEVKFLNTHLTQTEVACTPVLEEYHNVLKSKFITTQDIDMRLVLAQYLCSYGYASETVLNVLLSRIEDLSNEYIVTTLAPASLLAGKDPLHNLMYYLLSSPKRGFPELGKCLYSMCTDEHKRHFDSVLNSLPEGNTLETSLQKKKFRKADRDASVEIIRLLSSLVYQVMGRDTTGRTAWYFILTSPEMKVSFLMHQQGDNYDLADYGFIVESGYGSEVPDYTKKRLKKMYGFDNF